MMWVARLPATGYWRLATRRERSDQTYDTRGLRCRCASVSLVSLRIPMSDVERVKVE